MKRHVCIHAHCYQPPRENPWLEEVELQDSAHPFHDWNARITAECYAPNTASRILDADNRIIDIINNYSRVSFNFGPTLLSWLEIHQPDVYRAIIEANRLSKNRFNGHPAAMAQVYNHMIMPLANTRDKRTQIIWGIRDYQHRFNEQPEGIWLSETAVDYETLDLCVEQGIKFTILAPRQANRVRSLDEKEWQDVSGDSIDPKQPYLCKLPSGNEIVLYFYDGPVAQDLAFGDVLDDGLRFADRLTGSFVDDEDRDQLVHVATDGETYGHHHRFGDMALAYCLYHIEADETIDINIYANHLEKHPPKMEVDIHENSSWSCVHGVERWRSDCGCNTGRPGWHQKWRAPLRGAMDWLRDSLIMIYEEHASEFLLDNWQARDDYVDLVLDRSDEMLNSFLKTHSSRELSNTEIVHLLKLMEMQRYAMLMYTSCGWFFDEISGLETVQVIQYAARAIQLARDVAGIDLEQSFIRLLERAPSNLPDLQNGAEVYKRYVQPSVLDLIRVGAHYAVSSLFSENPGEDTDVYCFHAESDVFDLLKLGQQRLVLGKAHLQSRITREKSTVYFSVLHFGDQNLMGSVRQDLDDREFMQAHEQIKGAFQRGNIAEVIALTDQHLGKNHYSLWHLFKDEQRKAINQVVDTMLTDVKGIYRQVYQRHYPLIQATSEMSIPLPRVLSTTASFILNNDLRQALTGEDGKPDLDELEQLSAEANQLKIEIDKETLAFEASRILNESIEAFARDPNDLNHLEQTLRLFEILNELYLPLDLWRAQNEYFSMSKQIYPQKQEDAERGGQSAKQWLVLFDKLGSYLQVRSV